MRLIRTALIAASLCISLSNVARAQYELTWDQCAGSTHAAGNKRLDCSLGETRPLQLVLAFTPPRSIKEFVGFGAKIDFTSGGSTMPDWWRAGVGECRDGAVYFPNSVIAATGACQNPWAGANTGGGYQWTTGLKGAGSAMLWIVAARAEPPISLAAGTRYIAGIITIDASAGSSCGGCEAEVCVSVAEFEIDQNLVAGDSSTDPIVLTRSTGQSVVTFNVRNPNANACGSKVRNRTWGQVKSTYR